MHYCKETRHSEKGNGKESLLIMRSWLFVSVTWNAWGRRRRRYNLKNKNKKKNRNEIITVQKCSDCKKKKKKKAQFAHKLKVCMTVKVENWTIPVIHRCVIRPSHFLALDGQLTVSTGSPGCQMYVSTAVVSKVHVDDTLEDRPCTLLLFKVAMTESCMGLASGQSPKHSLCRSEWNFLLKLWLIQK